MLTSLGQAATFLLTVGLGFAFGIFYDIFRCLRRIFKLKVLFGAVLDMFFWLAVTAALFFFLLYINFGQLRMFVFLGLLIGFVLHLCTLSPFVLRLASAAKKGLRHFEKYVMIKGNRLAKEVVEHGTKANGKQGAD